MLFILIPFWYSMTMKRAFAIAIVILLAIGMIATLLLPAIVSGRP